MLKRTIEYEDFNGEKQSEVFYFNLSKPELIEMEVDIDGGFSRMLEKIIETTNARELIKRFKEIVLMAYGEKSDDGKNFIKTEEMRKKFEQSAAYQVLYMDLAMNEESAAIFLKGVLPADIVAEADKAEAEKTNDVKDA